MPVPAHPVQGPRDMDLLSFLLLHASPLIWESSHFHPDPAVVSRLLRLASLCLLGASESLEMRTSPWALFLPVPVTYVLAFSHRVHIS